MLSSGTKTSAVRIFPPLEAIQSDSFATIPTSSYSQKRIQFSSQSAHVYVLLVVLYLLGNERHECHVPGNLRTQIEIFQISVTFLQIYNQNLGIPISTGDSCSLSKISSERSWYVSQFIVLSFSFFKIGLICFRHLPKLFTTSTTATISELRPLGQRYGWLVTRNHHNIWCHYFIPTFCYFRL